ncbi:GNAT family N-acetyltransferase [Lentibacter algarum]|uniref:GNAT family N-acetyltransferase n=1 Tax=Lentibacter algarum TaxID=576131 RepID=UPI001C07B2CD|nr:GNAT family N-acetyltransferase [Lentibacter algarum]MBU2981000.1 GNAT family N-acetyltransferase [Lentibacter algarum]
MMLRQATPLDAGTVGGILSEFTEATDWLPKLHSRAEDISHADTMITRGWVQVAELQGAVCGFIARNGPEINALYVNQSARGKGVGYSLIRNAQAMCGRLELWTFQANTAALAFYRRQGFVCTEKSDGTTTDEKLPDVRLVWQKEG